MSRINYVGKSVRRVEDLRLLTGQTTFIGDICKPNMAYAVFVRSTEPNALIKSINVESAENAQGLIEILTGDDLGGNVEGLTKKFYQLTQKFVDEANVSESNYFEPILAVGNVVHVGQPIAVVVAETRQFAENIRDLIEVEYIGQTPVVDPEQAQTKGSNLVNLKLKNNVDAEFEIEIGDVDASEKNADLVLEREFYFGRSTGSPIENRGVVSEWNPVNSLMTVWSTTQIPYILKSNLQMCLKMDATQLEVLVPDMGGSFGGGIYPEEIVIPYLAKKLNRPIQWLEDRGESITNSRHSRDQRIKVRGGFDSAGKILSLDVRIVQDAGAFNPFGITLIHNVATHIRSQYRVPNFRAVGLAVLTNKTRNTPVRGAGRPEATLAIDRLLDIVAKQIGLDPAEIREKNLIPSSEIPYSLGMLYRDGVPATYDSGGFQEQFAKLLKESKYLEWRDIQKQERENGRFIGIGLSCHVEATGIGPTETSRIVLEEDGTFTFFTGAQPHGQSHHTVISQIVADQLGVRIENISVKSGNTNYLPIGSGTFGSRSAIVAGSSAKLSAELMRAKIIYLASEFLEANPLDIAFMDGVASVKGSSSRFLSLEQISQRYIQGTQTQSDSRLLAADTEFTPPTVVYGSGSHFVVLEVLPSTLAIKILDYVSVDDCGAMLNPIVVDGQVYGGVVHGVSNSLFEEVIYDEGGYCSNPNLVGYLLASSAESPRIRAFHIDHPTASNPLGVKGVGEGATSSAPAAIANAVSDALTSFAVEVNSLPITPWALFEKMSKTNLAEAL